MTTSKLTMKNATTKDTQLNTKLVGSTTAVEELAITEIPDNGSTTLQVQRMRFVHGYELAQQHQKESAIDGDLNIPEIELQMRFRDYTKERHTQEECIGFIAGWEAATQYQREVAEFRRECRCS